jgi:non-ribosomal peptide synthetase component F/thioesterase domain-containing protein
MATIIKLPSSGREPAEPRGSGSNQFNLAFPLSPAQERIWRADQQNPGDPAYNCAFRWSLTGPLDIPVLERAFDEIVCRHEILRATFTQIAVDPVQLIAPSVDLKVDIHDLRSVPESERESEIDRICTEEATRGFDIGTGPLIRVGIVRSEEQRHFLLLTLHLLISDGWSIRVIMGELQKLYSAFSEGRASPLPELSIQYPDYVVWKREGQAERAHGDQLAHWKSKLVSYRRLEVPGDLTPESEFTRNSDIVSLELPRELTDALNALSNRQGGTMFTTVLAACDALLSRYTGETDIAVGSELAGRNRTELEGLVGLFINHVVFRTDASGDPWFPELAERVRDTTWEIFANQDVAFEDVIKARKVDGETCPEPFVHVNFNCYRAYGGSSNYVLEPANIHVVPIPSISQGALYRLNFFMVERESGWRLSIDYNKDLYSRQLALQMLENFQELLVEIAANPERRISEFQLSGLPAYGKSSLLAVAATTPAAAATTAAGDGAADEEFYTLPASVVQERFWLLAKLDPSSPKFHMRATVRLTGSLSQDALERSFQSLVDRHEILRTTFAEEDGGLVQVIASRKKFSLSTVTLAEISAVDREENLQELLHEEARHPFDLEHGPLFRACLFCLQPNDFVLIITTHHIIADGWSQRVVQQELWAMYEALAGNRQPSLAPLSIQYADFAAWQKDWLRSQEANEHLNYWLKQLEGPLRILDFPTDHPPALRVSSNGGIESLSVPADLMQALKQLSRSEGVTMFTLTLACFAILISRCSNQANMVIGSPVANRKPETESLIGPFAGPIPFRFDLSDNPTLHDVLKRVSQVSLEALDHSDLPFEALIKQLRMQSVNGRTAFFQFYFLYQAAFLQPHMLPALTVTPMPTFSVGTPFELQLAMIERPDEVHVNVEYNADLFDPGSIQALLQYYEMLLRAMVSNPNWHVADLAAPAVGESFRGSSNVTAEANRRYEAPRNDDEIKLTEIWQDILNVPQIGVHDNFFELGGHSLLAAQLVSQVKAQFGITIDLSLLMVAPTIEQLTGKLRHSLQKDQSHIVAIREAGVKPPLFCIHGGGGHLLDYRDMIESLPEDQPIYGLRASDVNEAYPETVEELAEQYLLEIQGVQEHGPYQICGLSFGGLVAYEIARKLADKGERVGLIALFDTGNWAYYRNLPAAKMAQFRRTYIIDRLKKYGRNLVQGRFDDLAADARQFVTSRLNAVLWKTSRQVSRLMNRPVPQFVRSSIVVFSAVGQNYSPKPYPGRILLFRAEGRTAEYGDDLTLGWTDIAQDGVVVREVPGSHLSIMRKPQVDHLVRQLTPHLAGAPDGGAPQI